MDGKYAYYTSPYIYKFLINKYSKGKETSIEDLEQTILKLKNIPFDELSYLNFYIVNAKQEIRNINQLGINFSLGLFFYICGKFLNKNTKYIFLDNNRYMFNKMHTTCSIMYQFLAFSFLSFSTVNLVMISLGLVGKNIIVLQEEIELEERYLIKNI